ncbi:MAG: hypothetical protein EXS13_04600 [Planctomycetes bacterium]|nr:hypothetical protein [Planctomycetota bacterium]
MSMNDVEFVTGSPDASVAPPAAGRSRWTPDELEATLSDASSHVRYLLRELSQGSEVAASELKSRPVSYAQVQRICNSRGKEALVQPGLRGGSKCYSLHSAYRTLIARLVADAAVPPPAPPPKAPGERKPRMPRHSKYGSALDGVATLTAPAAPAAAALAPARRLSQGTLGRALAIPAEIEIEFCKELLGFMNGTANGTRYRIILEDVGYKLEAC